MALRHDLIDRVDRTLANFDKNKIALQECGQAYFKFGHDAVGNQFVLLWQSLNELQKALEEIRKDM